MHRNLRRMAQRRFAETSRGLRRQFRSQRGRRSGIAAAEMAATAQGRVNAMYSHRAFSDNNSGMRTPLPAIPWRYSVTAVNLKWQRHLVTINDLRNDHP